MSRSRRKSPYTGLTTAESDKDDKRRAHRALRRAEKDALRRGAETHPRLREVSNAYTFAKDGKQEIDPDSRWMRK